MEYKDFLANQDGSYQVSMDGKSTRLVLESDLIAVKKGAGEASGKWDTERVALTTDRDTHKTNSEKSHQLLLQEQAAHETTRGKQKDYDALVVKAGELEKSNGSLKELASKHEKELAARIRENMVSGFGAKEDALKDKTLDQLRYLEEAAKLIGNQQTRRPKYDNGDGGQPGNNESPVDRAKRLVAEQEQRQSKSVKVANNT